MTVKARRPCRGRGAVAAHRRARPAVDRRAAPHPDRLALLCRGPDPGRDRRAAGVSRVKVVRDLQIGRQTGLVQIQINGRLASCVALERALERRFELAQAVVVPTPHRRRASAGHPGRRARLLALRPAGARPDPGRRLGADPALERARPAPPRAAGPDRGVAPGRDRPRLRDQHVRDRLARRRDARARSATTSPPPPSRARRHCATCCWPRPGLRDVLERGRKADIALVSVGTLEAGRHQPPHRPARGRPTPPSWKRCGAVGDLLCTFLDAEGRPVDHPLNRCAVGLPVADLRQCRPPSWPPAASRKCRSSAPRWPALRQPPDHRRAHGRAADRLNQPSRTPSSSRWLSSIAGSS